MKPARKRPTCHACGGPAVLVDAAPPGESGDVVECLARCDLSPAEKRRRAEEAHEEQVRFERLIGWAR